MAREQIEIMIYSGWIKDEDGFTYACPVMASDLDEVMKTCRVEVCGASVIFL